MFEELNRPIAQYQRVIDIWLTTPGLEVNEAVLIRSMKTSLEKSLADFDQLRRIAASPAFINTLRSAAAKAQAAGLLLDWKDIAEAA